MGVFQNYFHLNQQMPTTSGFRGDFLFYNTRQHTVTKHKQFHATQNKTISSFLKQHTVTHLSLKPLTNSSMPHRTRQSALLLNNTRQHIVTHLSLKPLTNSSMQHTEQIINFTQ